MLPAESRELALTDEKLVIPALIGAFVGAPVLAKELETGTFRYTWTQGFGRARWTVATLAPLAVTVLAGAVGFLFSWCYEPLIGGRYGSSPLAGNTFDLHGVAFAAWTLTAFSIGVLAGILIRRVVPAMFATLVAWSGLAVENGVFLRPHYEAPLVTSEPNLPSTDWVMSQWWTRGGKPVSSSTIDEVLQRAGAKVSGGAVTQSPGSALGNMSPTQYLLHHGFTQFMMTTADLAAHRVLREHFKKWPKEHLAVEKAKGFTALVDQVFVDAGTLSTERDDRAPSKHGGPRAIPLSIVG
ncbi:MAG: hypothetical protein ACYDGN_12425 [Acidimicrobiales bacterium]